MRTGLTPREAKQKLTYREASEFLTFCALFPIDDRSNFQMPIASLHATTLNANRDPKQTPRAYTMKDTLLFQPAGEESIDDLLLDGDW